MVWLFFLLTLLLPRPSFAVDPTITITNFPSSVVSGDTFPITFTVFSGNTGIYHYKAVGESTTIEIFPSCASNYNNCGNIIIADTLPVIATAYAKIISSSSSNNLFIRLAESEAHSNTYVSNSVTIQSIQPTPTITPIPTSIPTPLNTPVPSPANTPIPTLVPSQTPTKVPTPTLFPTVTPLPTDNPTPINDPLPTDDPITPVLGASDNISPLPTVKTKSSSVISPNLIPTIFIVIGACLLLIPLIISKIKLKR